MINYIPEYIKPCTFLPGDMKDFIGDPLSTPCERRFISADTEELYKQNLKKMSSDWIYRQTPVIYTINSGGYRTAEFNTIDWSNSIVLFGCSNVFGTGVHDTATISSQLQQLTSIPVVNMGLPASSMVHSYYNQLILSEIEPKPRAIVNIWTSPERICSFTTNRIINNGPWDLRDANIQVTVPRGGLSHIDYITTNAAVHSHFARISARNLWRNTAYYECSYFDHTAKQLNIKQLQIVDKGRDDKHPGVLSHELSAKHIAQALNL